MSHSSKYDNMPYIVRKNLCDDVYFEIMDTRIKNGRLECLSRFNYVNSDWPIIGTFGYRWRKICGKCVFIPLLDRTAKDEHCCSLTIRNPLNGKMSRVYLRDLKRE